MKFRTAYDRGDTIQTPLGSETQPIYDYRIDKKTGRKILEKVGETNIYEMIQASHEGTKLENIIKRCTDPASLVAPGQYVDLTEVPTNLMELQNVILKAKGEFEKLDSETRKKFGNSAEQYVSLYGSEEWANRVGLRKETPKVTETRPETQEVTEVKGEN